MTERHTTETTDRAGNTTTHTVVTDNDTPKSGGTSWGLLVLLAVVAIAAIVIFSQMSNSEVTKDNAVAGAADQVGEAAGQIGDAAQNAGDAVQESVN